jgi:hypothetical protein
MPQYLIDIYFRHARPCAGHPRLLFAFRRAEDVDGQDKPGHDEEMNRLPTESH